MQMTVDVLDHDDRRIHQQAQRQDQGEQGDAVDGLSRCQAHGQHHEQDQGHGHGNDAGFAPAEEEHQDHHYRGNGDPQVHDQFVYRCVRFRAVIARHHGIYSGGNSLLLQSFQLRQDRVGHDHGIGARFFCDRQGDGGAFIRTLGKAGRTVGEARGFLDLVGAVFDACDVLEIGGRAASGYADHDLAHFLGRTQETGQPQRPGKVVPHQLAQGGCDIGAAQHRVDSVQAESRVFQALWIDPDVHRLIAPADDLGEGHTRDVTQLLQQPQAYLTQP